MMEQSLPVWLQGRQDEKNLTAGFYAPLSLEGKHSAVLKLAAAGHYHVYLNGEHLAYGPVRCAHGWHRVSEIDLAGAAGPRISHLAIEINVPRVNTFFLADQPPFLQAEVWADGECIARTLPEGGRFVGLRLPYREQKVERYSYQRGFSEVYDLTGDWNGWRSGRGMAEPLTGCEPKRLIPARRPLPALPEIAPRWLVKQKPVSWDFVHAHPWDDRCTTGIGELIGGYRREECTTLLTRDISAILPDHESPVSVPFAPPLRLKKGDGAWLRFDGEKTGFLTMEIEWDEPGVMYALYDEILTDGDVNPLRMSLIGAMKLTFSRGVHRFTAFEPAAMQYLKLVCAEGRCTIRRLHLLEAAAPAEDYPPLPEYVGDGLLRQIDHAAVETLRQNSYDLFTDCPSRERAGWSCDSFFMGRAEWALTGADRTEKTYLENYFLPERYPWLKPGVIPMCYPSDPRNGNFIPNWMLWLLLETEEYVRRTGDREMAELAEKHLLDALNYCEGFENELGLLEKLEAWVFVEWSKANELVQDVNAPSNMLYAAALEAVARLYDRPALAEKAARVRHTLRDVFFDGTLWHDRALRQEGGGLTVTEECTETCQYYAFFFDLSTPDDTPELFQNLFAADGAWLAASGLYPSNAFIGKLLRMLILDRYGRKGQVLDEIRASYGEMARQTGTLWEFLSPRASCCHGFAGLIAPLIRKNAE